MLVEISQEFERVATLKSAGYVNKKLQGELEDYAQDYDFTQPLINWVPIENINASIIDSGAVTYPLDCVVQFLNKADTSEAYEAQKDIIVDDMIALAQSFFRELNKNTPLLFKNTGWDLRFRVLRPFLTSNFLVGVEVSVTLETSCNRI